MWLANLAVHVVITSQIEMIMFVYTSPWYPLEINSVSQTFELCDQQKSSHATNECSERSIFLSEKQKEKNKEDVFY